MACCLMCNGGFNWHRSAAASVSCPVDVSELAIDDRDNEITHDPVPLSPGHFTAAVNTGL